MKGIRGKERRNKRTRKFLAVLLAVTTILSMTPFMGFALDVNAQDTSSDPVCKIGKSQR